MAYDDPILRRLRQSVHDDRARRRRANKLVKETIGKRRRGAIIARLREPDRNFGRR